MHQKYGSVIKTSHHNFTNQLEPPPLKKAVTAVDLMKRNKVK